MINKLIIDTLASLNIPVAFQEYKGIKQLDGSYKIIFPYVTFFEYLEQSESFSEDEEDSIGHYMQVDIWSKSDYTSIVTQVKTLLKNAGFKRNSKVDLYESEMKLYHKGMRFFYLEEII